MNTKNEILLEMAQAGSVEAVWDIHTKTMRSFGFDRLVYGFNRYPLESNVGHVRDAIVLSNHSSEYMEYFVGHKMYLHGPMTKWASENQGSRSWAHIQDMATAGDLTKEQLKVCEINQKLGVTSGYTISFHKGHESTKAGIGLSAHSSMTQHDVEMVWAEKGVFIEVANYVMHLQISRLPHPTELIRNLTARQQEVLYWAAQGKMSHETAMIMNVTKVTVDRHLQLAREALDTTTTAHAVMKASNANLFLAMSP